MSVTKLQMYVRDSSQVSRRAADLIIREGRVTVSGRVVLEPAFIVDTNRDHVKVDGKLLHFMDSEKYYYVFNKPKNIVCTMDDPEGRPCLGELLKPLKQRLFSVGRLDFDAEGLLLLTNDGELAQKLAHPSNRVPRVYLVKVKGNPDETELSKIRKGLSIGEGDRIGDVNWKLIRKQGTTTWMNVELFEGKKNEVKRIFFAINHPVRKIRRIAFGPIKLGSLPVGHWRPLTESERSKLMTTMNKAPAQRPRRIRSKS
jgi:23S rRNA pseudouridine2605 synthase